MTKGNRTYQCILELLSNGGVFLADCIIHNFNSPLCYLFFSVDAEVPILEDISDVEQEKTDEDDVVTSSQSKSKVPRK